MIAAEFGRFAAHTRYGDLPAEVVATVKVRLLDALGVSLAASASGTHRLLMPMLNGPEQATAWGTEKMLGVRDAALVNGFLCHSLYLNDGSRFAGNHPSAVVIPAAFAMAESRRLSGSELIAAIAIGYEVALYLGRAIYPAAVTRGFQPTSVTGAAAAAAACANLLHLSADGAKNAVAIAAFMGVGLKEASKSPGSQPLQVGRACEGGVLAALFASEGATGADGIFEGGFLKAFAGVEPGPQVLDGLGSHFRISETYIKMHGGCRGNHAPLDVVAQLMREHELQPDSIARIAVRVDSVTDAGDNHAPATGSQAQFSAAFAIASLLVFGDASSSRYTDANLADPRIRQMMMRVHVQVAPEYDEGYPDIRPASAEIETIAGDRFQAYIRNAKGEPEDPFSAAEIQKKFLQMTNGVLPDHGQRLIDLVMRLEEVTDTTILGDAMRARR